MLDIALFSKTGFESSNFISIFNGIICLTGECHMVLTPDRTGSPAVGVMTSTDKSGQQQQQRSESSTSGIATGDESDNLPDDHDEQVSLHGYHNCIPL